MPTTPRGLIYPGSGEHTRLWEHLQNLADSTDDALDALETELRPAVESTVVTANSATTTTELVVASAAITAEAGVTYEVSFGWYNVVKSVASDVFLIGLYDGAVAGAGTQIAQWLAAIGQANGGSGFMRRFVTPGAGAKTYTARITRSSGTGNALLAATATSPAELAIRPISGVLT